MIYVFDLDGTLIDSELRHGILIKKVLQEEGLAINASFVDKYIENKKCGKNSKIILKEEYGLDEGIINSIVNKWISEIESDEMLQYDKLFYDSLEILEKLRKSSYSIYFLSLRSRRDAAIKELNRLGIFHYATGIYIGDPLLGKQYKAKKLQEISLREEVIMIGDTEIDYEASEIARVSSYILSRGFRNESFLNKNGIKSYIDLSHLIM